MSSQQYQLIHRDTTHSEQACQSVETSLFKSHLTGLYVLEQIQEGAGKQTLYNAVSLTPDVVAKLLPSLKEIAESGPEPTTEIPVL